MKSNALIIGLLIIIIVLIIGIGYLVISNQDNDNQIVNNTSDNNAENKTLNAVIVSNNESNDTRVKHYDDWQKDYQTGDFDEYGSPIYRSVISTSGGQYEPGIYESYWSENGPISEERIG